MREAMKQALEALELVLETDTKPKHEISKSITSLRQAIEQAEKQEPVAVVTGTYGGRFTVKPVNPAMVLPLNMALYTTPPHCKPLSDVEIWNTYKNLWMFHPAEEPRLAGDVLKFARAIEQAHGIKE